MNRNVRIAKELVKLAKSLVSDWENLPGPGDFEHPDYYDDYHYPYEDSDIFTEKSKAYQGFVKDLENFGWKPVKSIEEYEWEDIMPKCYDDRDSYVYSSDIEFEIERMESKPDGTSPLTLEELASALENKKYGKCYDDDNFESCRIYEDEGKCYVEIYHSLDWDPY